jgi:hypothetical protein
VNRGPGIRQIAKSGFVVDRVEACMGHKRLQPVSSGMSLLCLMRCATQGFEIVVVAEVDVLRSGMHSRTIALRSREFMGFEQE